MKYILLVALSTVLLQPQAAFAADEEGVGSTKSIRIPEPENHEDLQNEQSRLTRELTDIKEQQKRIKDPSLDAVAMYLHHLFIKKDKIRKRLMVIRRTERDSSMTD